jgi:hypothetical protein
MAQEIENLPSKHKALQSNPNTAKKKAGKNKAQHFKSTLMEKLSVEDPVFLSDEPSPQD